MSYVQLYEGGFPRLVVPALRSCQRPSQIWLANYSHLHVHQHHKAAALPFTTYLIRFSNPPTSLEDD